MFSQTLACTVLGSDAVPVVVEASIHRGLPAVVILGMRASERAEVRERVRCGLAAVGVDIGMRRVVVSIAPADLPKSGAALDLPIAIAILAALGVCKPERVATIASHGELGLDGGIRPADGVVASAFAALRSGATEFVVSEANAARAALAPTRVTPVATLADVLAHLRGKQPIEPIPSGTIQPDDAAQLALLGGVDLGDVRAQAAGVDALIVAAAGGHNLLMFGVPGCGKTMLAQRMPTILPALRPDAALEVATIHDAAGLRERELATHPPFRAPHHSISTPALVGGGSTNPVVGEITLAHRGVLFLDELPEFRPTALDALRQPLEEGEIRIRRAGWIARYPCESQLVAAMNLCRCGRDGATSGPGCTCNEQSRRSYRERVSGAILDRFDMRVRMRASGSIVSGTARSDSAAARIRVQDARERQHERWGANRLNGEVRSTRDRRLNLQSAAHRRLDTLVRANADGGRVQRAAVRVARTIADLDGVDHVSEDHVLEAYEYARTAASGSSDARD